MDKEFKHLVFLEIPQETKEILQVLADASKMSLEEYEKLTLDEKLKSKPSIITNCTTCAHQSGKGQFASCELYQYYCSVALHGCCKLDSWQPKDLKEQNSPLKKGFWANLFS